MHKRKMTLGIILVLLIFFLPLSIVSFVLHKKYAQPKVENPKHEFRFDNQLYFYQGKELLGKYECQNFNDYCDYATTNSVETNTKLKEYVSSSNKLNLIEGRFAFLIDSSLATLSEAPIHLYDLLTNRSIGEYKEIKNYGVGIENANYIVKNDEGLWGVMNFSDGVMVTIPFQYDFIGVVNRFGENGKLLADAFVVQKGDSYQLLDANGQNLSIEFNKEIYTYGRDSIILSDENNMQIVNYEGASIINGNFIYLDYYENNSDYLNIIDSKNQFYIYNLKNKSNLSSPHYVEKIEDVRLEEESGMLRMYIQDVLTENIVLDATQIPEEDVDLG